MQTLIETIESAYMNKGQTVSVSVTVNYDNLLSTYGFQIFVKDSENSDFAYFERFIGGATSEESAIQTLTTSVKQGFLL